MRVDLELNQETTETKSASALRENVRQLDRADKDFSDARQLVKERSEHKSFAREWDFCDQCIFYRTCFRPERKQGDGCFEAFYPYPFSTFTDDQIELKSRRLLGLVEENKGDDLNVR